VSKEILLNPEMIYNWDFKVDARGYRPQEVDKVLDMCSSDYRTFENIIRDQKAQIDALNNEILVLKQKLRNAKANMDLVKNNSRQITNVDLLRRISELEKIVYGDREE